MNFKIESWRRLAGTRSVRFLFDLGVALEGHNKNRIPALAAIDIALTTASRSDGLAYSASTITLAGIRRDEQAMVRA